MHILAYEAGHDAISHAGLGALHHALYSAIYRLANRARWAEEFEVSRELLMCKSGIGDHHYVIKALRELAGIGLIKYNPGVGRKPSTAGLIRVETNPNKQESFGLETPHLTGWNQPIKRGETNPNEAPIPYIINKTYKTNKTLAHTPPIAVEVEVLPEELHSPAKYNIQIDEEGKAALALEAEREEEQKKKVAPKKKREKPRAHCYDQSPYHGEAALKAAFADKPWAAKADWPRLHQQMTDWLDRETGEPPKRQNWKAVANTFIQHDPSLKDASLNRYPTANLRPGSPYAAGTDYRSRKEQATAAQAHRYV